MDEVRSPTTSLNQDAYGYWCSGQKDRGVGEFVVRVFMWHFWRVMINALEALGPHRDKVTYRIHELHYMFLIMLGLLGALICRIVRQKVAMPRNNPLMVYQG